MIAIEIVFPGLVGTDNRITSPTDTNYNCIAWATGRADGWWWPDSHGESFLPESAPRRESIDAFILAFASIGYHSCPNDSHESGIEKVAIFARDGTPTHAARQLPNGRWSSKLGSGEDIEHELDAVSGRLYGVVAIVLQRFGT